MTLSRMTLIALAVLAAGVVLSQFGSFGPPRGFWPDGMRRHQGRGEFGRERGEWSYWYPNGQLRERGRYVRGKRNGTWSQWYSNGHRASTGERAWSEDAHASLREGAWTTWYDNGVVRSQGTYRAGKRDGAWSFWRLEGDLAVLDEDRSGRYEADRKVEE